MEMQFRVEGVPLRVLSLKVDDPIAADSERLKDRTPDIKGQPYSLFAVELFEMEQGPPAIFFQGFLRAQIGPPQAQLVPDMNDPQDELRWILRDCPSIRARPTLGRASRGKPTWFYYRPPWIQHGER